MVEPLTVVIRNSLFPGRSVLQSTSYPTCPTLVGGVMHHQHQHRHPFFSSNLSDRPRGKKEKNHVCVVFHSVESGLVVLRVAFSTVQVSGFFRESM